MSIFLDALDVPSREEREAFLDRACGGDEHLRAGVEQLLRAHDLPDNPIDQVPPEVDAARTVLQEAVEGDDGRSGRRHDPNATVPGVGLERPGASIGPYRLMEQIG